MQLVEGILGANRHAGGNFGQGGWPARGSWRGREPQAPLVVRRGPAHWGFPSARRGPPRTQASTSGRCSCSSPRCRRRRPTGSTPSPSAWLRSTTRSSGGRPGGGRPSGSRLSGGRPGGGRPSGSRLPGGRPRPLVWAQASQAASWPSGPCGAVWDGKWGLLEEGRRGCILGLGPGYLPVPGHPHPQTSRQEEKGSP